MICHNTCQIIKQTLAEMNQAGINIYTNFELKPQQYTKKIKAVIMGHCGNGKTSFINKLCNTRHSTGVTKNSLTRDIEYEEVILPGAPQNSFILYDTPGTNANQLAMQHALVLKRTLQIPLNLILLQSKFDERFELHTLPQLNKLTKIFKGYEQNIEYNKIDSISSTQVKNKSQIIKDFSQSLKQNEVNFKVILYSNKNSSADKLANILYSIGFMNETINMKISDKIFYKYFKLEDINYDLVPQKISEYLEQIQNISESYLNFLNKLPSGDPQNDQLIADLKAHMKYDLKTTQNNQYMKYEIKFPDKITSDLYLLISQKIQRDLQNFDNKSSLKIAKQYYYEYDSKNYDIRDLFKKCPSSICNKIWMRADGCDGLTYCGTKPDFFDFFKSKKLWKYSFKRDQQKIICTKNQLKKLTPQQITAHKQKTKKESVKQVQRKDQGCGEAIIWKNQPRLPNIEQILLNLYGISNFEQIKSDHDFVRKISQKRYEQIDKRVKLNEEKLKKSQFKS